MTLRFHGSLADHYETRLKEAIGFQEKKFVKDSFNYHSSQYNQLRNVDNHLHGVGAVCTPPEGLTEKEKSLYEALSQAGPHNVTTVGIKACLLQGTADSFRGIMRELKQQNNEAPSGLRMALGDELFEMVASWNGGEGEQEFD